MDEIYSIIGSIIKVVLLGVFTITYTVLFFIMAGLFYGAYMELIVK